MTATPPTATVVSAPNGAVPTELTQLRQWIVWRYVERGGKFTKPPFRATAPEVPASSTDPETWGTYADAVAAVEAGQAEGIGFVFTPGDPFAGIDFDYVDEDVVRWVGRFDSYTEESPSSRGLHVIVRGTLDDGGRKRGGVEIYDGGRYFTVTGKVVPSASGDLLGTLADRQEALGALYSTLAPSARPTSAPPGPAQREDLGDRDLIERARLAKNGADFARLYDRGDWEGASYCSQSEADLALCGMLAFWAGWDAERVDRLFRAGALMREKWGRSVGQGETYGARTVRMAVELTAKTCSPRDFDADEEPSGDGAVQDRPVPWPAPTPLRGPKRPSFPVLSVLSDGWRFITETATSTQTPVDLAAMTCLGTLAAAVRGRCEIEVREGWREPLTLYVATILPSGEGKSPVVSRAVRPLREVERELAEEARRDVARGQALYRTAQKRLEKAERDAANADGADRYVAEEKVLTIADELAQLSHPDVPRILADDATPEALVSLLAAHERIAVVSAEGGIFDVLAGRYSDGVANLDGVLKAWDGESIRADRRGRDAEHVERPILSLCVAVQPHVMETLRDKPAMRGRGLAARFLYSIPESALGTRDLNPPTASSEAAGWWSRTIRELARPSDRTDRTPAIIALSPEARKLHTAFRAKIEPRLHPDTGDLYDLSDWAAKLAGNVARVAGLLHLAELGWAGAASTVSAETMAAAAAIGEYMIPHAQAALAEPGRDFSRAAAVLRWLRSSGRGTVSVREVQNALGSSGGFPDAQSVRAALDVLGDHGYVRPLPRPSPGPKGGQPPSPRYEVHPDVCGESTGAAREPVAGAEQESPPPDEEISLGEEVAPGFGARWAGCPPVDPDGHPIRGAS